MSKLPRQCPSCSTALEITRLTCPQCQTEVTGRYPPDFFAALAPNDFDFLVLFIQTKGNIKEMERELGISYWSIRTRLNEIVDQLDLGAAPTPPVVGRAENMRQEILQQLNDGLISFDEAAARLDELKKQDQKRR